ncbi:MAG: hypothetical protein U0988_07660, partial [Allopontixanthobacter sp.]|nr:hypothetical protein [Allopontixanthobacter sp.]
ANGGLAGQLDLAAPTIRAISDAAAAAIGGATVLTVNTRLGQNDGAVNDAGYFSAAQLSFTVEDALLIQNSGAGTAFDDRRGFTADTVPSGTANPAAVLVVNGTVGGLTGIDALSAAGVPSQFDPGSTINGCFIGNPAFCGIGPGFRTPVPGDPIQDLIEEEIDPRGDDESGGDELGGDEQGGDDLGGILVDLRDTVSREDDPLLDDPVTGAGNEDLWVSGPDCEGVDADSEACREPAE